MYRRIYRFFIKNNVLCKQQFGFRKNHSTSLSLLRVIDSCFSHLDANHKVVGIYFDLCKAFDTVDHVILLQKLYHYGIRGLMYNWIKNYLFNRKQFTCVNDVSSHTGNIICGVPQGSVLGPLLFLVYVNDIANAVPGSDLGLFADDTNLFISDSDINSLQQTANIYLKQMEAWFIANKLSLNIDKTCYSIFSKGSPQRTNITLCIDNKLIARVPMYKYLGVIIDEFLKWDEHIDYVYKKLLKFIGIFYKLRNIIPHRCMSSLYFSFVYPHLLYGIEVFGNASKSSLDKLCKLNNKLIRILLFANFSTSTCDL